MNFVRRIVLVLLGGLLFAGATATVAQAQDFRFWGYYQVADGQWVFAQKGPNEIVPKDGSVEGWRYAVGGAKPRMPRAAGDFNAICGATPAETGKKRVAVVIDPGTAEDSEDKSTPPAATGTCVVTAPASTGAQVLAAIAPVRIEGGLTCAIDGYPATGCGGKVKNATIPATDAPVQLEIRPAVGSSAPTGTEDEGTPWTPIIIGVAVIALLGTGGLVLSRRRSAN